MKTSKSQPDSLDDQEGEEEQEVCAQEENIEAVAEQSEPLPPNPGRFHLLINKAIHKRLSVQYERFDPPSLVTEPSETWHAPLLVTSIRGHMLPIMSLEFVARPPGGQRPLAGGLIISGSSDCSVRAWTVDGQLVGLFGRKTPWSLDCIIVVIDREEEERREREEDAKREELERQKVIDDVEMSLNDAVPGFPSKVSVASSSVSSARSRTTKHRSIRFSAKPSPSASATDAANQEPGQQPEDGENNDDADAASPETGLF